MRKEEESSKGKYPWLEDTDERKYMTDREILDKYINLDNSCLTKVEKTKVRDLLYKYEDAFSLRDEIGLCPNMEIEIDVTDKSPFFIGLSFLFIEKELCEARAKLEMGSNLADEPTLANVLPLPSPHLKLLDKKVTAMCFHTVNENRFETVI